MIKQYKNITVWTLILLLSLLVNFQNVYAQPPSVSVSGRVLESGSRLPLKQVSISVALTGVLSETNDKGEFTITVPDEQAELIIDLPGYTKRSVFLLGRETIEVSLVPSQYKSFDQLNNTPTGTWCIKDAVNSQTAIYSNELKFNQSTSFEQALQGIVPGLQIVEQSGMPGSISSINMGGYSSIYCRNEPLLLIDGMIQDYNYATQSIIEGFSFNPMDILDVEDVSDLSVIKNGNSYFGALSSNGVINVNTEQKNEASTVIQISAYGGIRMMPQQQEVLNSSQFKDYFSNRLTEEGLSSSLIDQKYPWLNGQVGSTDYYRYNNNTNWHNEIYTPGALSKFHIFLKGGDEIATYNISAGFLKHEGAYSKTGYSRFNLRINGKINITDRFSITPNVKLSLADSHFPNQGTSVFKNPLISGILIPSILQPYSRDEKTGGELPFLDDVSSFNVSNPVSIITNAIGTNRNYNFLSSIKAQYKISNELTLNNLVGINFNNARENIFLPDQGLAQVDSAANSPGVFVNEFRSTQNHATIDYKKETKKGHYWNGQAGARLMMNSYKFNKAISLNTPSDDFKKLNDGAKYNYLRTSTGDDRKLNWVSYFATIDYNFRNKYYLNLNASYDGNSSNNEKNRYNLFPSAGIAWRVSSEKILSGVNWIDDLKLRANWSITGNVYSSVYDYSKLYYTEKRMDYYSILIREAIPNQNLEMEKKMTINAGADISLFKQTTNLHIDYYTSTVNNLIIEQELPSTYGYTSYFDNGGKLGITGLNVGIDQRIHIGLAVLKLGATLSYQKSVVEELSFIKQSQEYILTETGEAEYITKVGNSINSFWGYKTDGIFQSDAEASQYMGPKGIPMKAGDIRFVDIDGNKVIDNQDKMIIGDPNPDFFGGITAALTIGKFELAALLSYSTGNDIYNYVRSKAEAMDTYSNQFVSVLDRWSPSNTDATMPRAAYGDPSGNNVFSDRWIEDGSYFSLKKLTLSYELPRSTLYKGITLYVTGSNLFTSTKYSGYDPEFMYSNSPFYIGIDSGKIPHTRSFIFGIKLDL